MKQSAPANFNPATAPPDRDADYVVYGQQENGYSRSSTRFFGDLVAYLVEALADHLVPMIDGLLIVARFRAGPHVTRHPLFDTLRPLYFLPTSARMPAVGSSYCYALPAQGLARLRKRSVEDEAQLEI